MINHMAVKKIYNEHDKIMKKILSNKKEAVILLNEIIEPKERIKQEEIELVEKEFVTNNFQIREADMIYKIKDKDVYIVVEHQSKTDYAMPYRIAQYKFETWERTIDKEKYKNKNYKLPLVVGILIYTGNPKWNVKQNTNEVETEYKTIIDNSLGIGSFYFLVDVNNYSEEELTEKGTLLSKIMLLEKAKSLEELIDNLKLTLNKLEIETKEGSISIEEKEILYNYINKVLLKKLPLKGEEKILKEIKSRGADVDMGTMAVFDMIEREKKMYVSKGRKDGKKEGKLESKMEIAKKLFEINMPINQIKTITGLTDKQIKASNIK